MSCGVDHVVMGNPRHGEGTHRAGIPVRHRGGSAERHGRQKVQHPFRLLDDDTALGDALEAEQPHLAEAGVDVGQDIDGFGHLGQRIAAVSKGLIMTGMGSGLRN